MAIIPAEPADAFWNFSKLLADLLGWATHPDPAPLNNDWLKAYKDRVRDVAAATIRSAETLGDDSLVAKIKAARKLGVEFVTLLCDRPALSTVAVENWTVPRYRELFDNLSTLEREFEMLGNGELPTPTAGDSDFDEGTDTTDTKARVEQRALAVLVVHPDWTVKRIAEEVGTRREYLSSKDCPKFKAARAAIRTSSIPFGSKRKDGSIEAIDDDLDFDAMDERMRNKR